MTQHLSEGLANARSSATYRLTFQVLHSRRSYMPGWTLAVLQTEVLWHFLISHGCGCVAVVRRHV